MNLLPLIGGLASGTLIAQWFLHGSWFAGLVGLALLAFTVASPWMGRREP